MTDKPDSSSKAAIPGTLLKASMSLPDSHSQAEGVQWAHGISADHIPDCRPRSPEKGLDLPREAYRGKGRLRPATRCALRVPQATTGWHECPTNPGCGADDGQNVCYDRQDEGGETNLGGAARGSPRTLDRRSQCAVCDAVLARCVMMTELWPLSEKLELFVSCSQTDFVQVVVSTELRPLPTFATSSV